MLNKGPNIPPIIATGIICLIAGGALGYISRDPQSLRTAGGSPNMAGGGGPGGGMSGGRGGGAPPSGSAALTRLMRNLTTVQKVQNKGLTPQQAQQLAPMLKAIQSADQLPPSECDAKVAEIEKVLTADQKQALTDLQPQRGGGARGGANAGGTNAGGGPPQSGGAPMGGMPQSGGAQQAQDPNKPFASERNKKILDDLISELSSTK